MLWLFLLVIIGLGFFFLTRRDRRLVLLYNQLPCDAPQLPIIGHLYQLLGSSEHTMNAIQMLGKMATSKGGLMGIWHINMLFLMVTDAVASEYILKHCLEKSDIMKLASIVLGDASIFAPVPIWRPRRKLNTPAFSPKKLKGFVNIFSKQSFILVEKLKDLAGKKPVAMWEYLPSYSMDAVCESTMGVKFNTQQNPNNPFIIGMKEILRIAFERFKKPWLHVDCVFTMIHPKVKEYKQSMYSFIEKLIEEIRKSAVEQAKDNPEIKTNISKSILSIMMNLSDEEPELTDVALKEETFLLVGAGTDTSAVGIAFTIVMLSRYPHVQEKVYQELREVFGNSNRPVVAEDLPHLKYLEAVIKESMRLYPPAPIIFRKVDNDVTLPSGITLVKGCQIFINIWAVHRNPQYWGPDAEEFRPERFIEAPLKHPAAFIPFSYGPRGCIGYQYAYMSMKTTIASILRNFRLSPAPDPVTGIIPQADAPLKLKYELMMRDVNNFVVCLDKRS